VVAQASRFRERLVPFCGVNPLREYSVVEVRRCASLPGVRGVKLHFANSRVDVANPMHLTALRRIFREANARRLAIMVHLWTLGGTYGAADARVFLDSILPSAPDVPVQIAHLAGGGGYSSDDALAVFAEALAARDPRVRHVYFDIATDVTESTPDATLRVITARLRQIGLDRILFGADTPIDGRPAPLQAWATFRRRIPLSNDELRVIASNVAPYLRAGSEHR
jgi:predicted TIM-barrel fold metal-dependent hydrolase